MTEFNDKIYRTIDLCAGIGGIRRGFEMTGRFQNVLSAEIDKYACQTYSHLFKDNPFNDITSDSFKSRVRKMDYEVLLAGFPCQSFSSAGKELGFSGTDKGTLFFHIVTIIRKTRPKAIFLENVENLVRHDKGETFKKIITVLEEDLRYKVIGVERSDFNDLVYDSKDFVRNSKNFGVPQNRPRVYIAAFDKKLLDSKTEMQLPSSTPSSGSEVIFQSLDDVLEMGAPDRFYLSSGYLETLFRHRERNAKKGNGFGYRIVNEPGVLQPIANTIMATGGSGKERNLVIDVQPGIAGKILPSKRTPLNDQCVRTMTPSEWGKLQGFIGYGFVVNGIENFSFPEGISIAQQYKQLGNSVTIPVIKRMAQFMADCLDSIGA